MKRPIAFLIVSLCGLAASAAASAGLTADAFYVAPPEAVLSEVADTSQVGGITVDEPTELPPCIRMNHRDVYPYWTVMPPLTGVPEGCWGDYEAEIAEAKARRYQSIMNCILQNVLWTDICACVTNADNRFILDCESAEDAFWECCGIDPPVYGLAA